MQTLNFRIQEYVCANNEKTYQVQQQKYETKEWHAMGERYNTLAAAQSFLKDRMGCYIVSQNTVETKSIDVL